MAAGWTNKVPNEPFVDSNGRYSVVIEHEYDLSKTPAELSDYLRSSELIYKDTMSIAKQGYRRILEKHGKQVQIRKGDAEPAEYEHQQKFPSTDSWATTPEAPGDALEVQTFGSYARAVLAGAGNDFVSPGSSITEAQFKIGERAYDVEGPFFPPRPNVRFVLYKFSMRKEIFEKLVPKLHPVRESKLESTGNTTITYKEVEFASYDDLGTQLAELTLVLEEYEGSHVELQTKTAKSKNSGDKTKDSVNGPQIFHGPNIFRPNWPNPALARADEYGTLNLKDESERLNDLSIKIKEFLLLNNINLEKEKIIIGFYPVKPELNPAKSEDEDEDALTAKKAETAGGIYSETYDALLSTIEEVTSHIDGAAAPAAFTSKYLVLYGHETVMSIALFYTGAQIRYQELVEYNSFLDPKKWREERGWLGSSTITSLESLLREIKQRLEKQGKTITEIEEDAEYKALNQDIAKAKNPELQVNDILRIPPSWISKIVSDKGWLALGRPDSSWYAAVKPSVLEELAPSTPSPPGPVLTMNPNGDFADPWEEYHTTAQWDKESGLGRVAYFKRVNKEYQTALKQYKTALSNWKNAPEYKSTEDEDFLTAPTKAELQTRSAEALEHLKKVSEKESPFLWNGFIDLVKSNPAMAKRTLHFLTNLDIVVNEPGVKGALSRFCSPNKKAPKDSKPISLFVKKYIYDPPSLRRMSIDNETDALNFYRFHSVGQSPMGGESNLTWDETSGWNDVTRSKAMKTAVSRPNQKYSDMAGDAVFASLPRSVDRINSKDDVMKYVLARLSLPQLAEEIMKCLGFSLTLNDVIDALCDGFLKKMTPEGSPEKIEEFFKKLRNGTFNFEREGIEFVDTARMGADIQKFLSEYIAQGANDPFYRAVIQANINNADGKRLICELILGALFALGDFLANLDSGEVSHSKSVPAIPQCKVPPTFDIPWLSIFGNILQPLVKQLELRLYSLLDLMIRWPVKKLLEMLADCNAEEEPEFGAPPPPTLPGKEQELKDLFNRYQPALVTDPRDFLTHLLSTLTLRELCELINGTAAPMLLLHVRKFMKINYSEFHKIFYTDYKVLAFFGNLKNMLDLSACEVSPLISDLKLDDLCKDGITPRQEALRRSLLAKGLTEAEVEAQLELDRQIKKDMISTSVNAMLPSPLDSEVESELAMNSIISESKALRKSNNLAVDTSIDSVQTMLSREVSNFIPEFIRTVAFLQTGPGGNYSFTDEAGNPIKPFSKLVTKLVNDMIWNSKGVPGFQGPSSKWPHQLVLPVHKLAWTPGAAHLAVPPQPGWIYDPGVIAVEESSTIEMIYRLLDSRTSGAEDKDDRLNFSVKNYKGDTGILKLVDLYHVGYDIDEKIKKLLSELSLPDTSPRPKQVNAWGIYLEKKIEKVYKSIIKTDPATAVGGWHGIDNLKMNIAENYDTVLYQQIYNLAFESILIRILRVIETSPFLNLADLRQFKNLDFNKHGLGDLGGLKKDIKERISSLMGLADFTSGSEPTYVGKAIFEGATRCIMKVELIKQFLKGLPAFTKFKIDDIFGGPIMKDVLVSGIKNLQIVGKSGTFYELYIEKAREEEERLRNKLKSQGPSSSPPLKVLTDSEIDDAVKEQLYTSKAGISTIQASTPEEYFTKLAFAAAAALQEPIGVSLAATGLRQSDIDEQIDMALRAAAAGTSAQDVSMIKSAGNTTTNDSHSHKYVIDTQGNGIAEPEEGGDGHKHPIEKWIVLENGVDTDDFHNHELELKAVETAVVNSITTKNADLRWKDNTYVAPGSDSTWQNASSKWNPWGRNNSTLMQQHFIVKQQSRMEHLNQGTESVIVTNKGFYEPVIKDNRYGIDGMLIEVPSEVTLPPGTNWVYEGLSGTSSTYGYEGAFAGFTDWIPPGGREASDASAPYPDSGTWSSHPLGNKGASHPIIRLRVPTRGHSEVDVHTATYFTFVINGEKLHHNARVFLYGLNFHETYEFHLGPPHEGSHENLSYSASPDADYHKAHGYLHIYDRYPGVAHPETHPDAIADGPYVDKLQVTMPIQSYGAWGALATREETSNSSPIQMGHTENPSWHPETYPGKNSRKCRFGHGHVDEMNGKIVVDDLYVLAVQNPGQGASFGPLYFHTFTPFFRGHLSHVGSLDHWNNDPWIDGQHNDGAKDRIDGKEPPVGDPVEQIDNPKHFALQTNPENLSPQWRNVFNAVGTVKNKLEQNNHPKAWAMEVPFVPGPRIGEIIGPPAQAFPLGVYGADEERWDILDVADVVGIRRDTINGSNPKVKNTSVRETVLCQPRFSRDDQNKKLRGSGGFVLEKYVKIKFKTRAELLYISQNAANPSLKLGIENITRALYGDEIQGFANTFDQWIDWISISLASDTPDFEFKVGEGVPLQPTTTSLASEWAKYKVYADRFSLKKFNVPLGKKPYSKGLRITELAPGLVLPASEYNILSFDAFARLQKYLLRAMPTQTSDSQITVAEVRRVLTALTFKHFVKDIKFGLRVSYVLPINEDKWHSYRHILRNMFSPTTFGEEQLSSGQWKEYGAHANKAVRNANQKHLSNAKAAMCALHLTEFEGTNVIPGDTNENLILDPVWSLPQNKLYHGDKTKGGAGLFNGEQEAISLAEAINAKDPKDAEGLMTVDDYIFSHRYDYDVPGHQGLFQRYTTLRVQKEIFVLPLIEEEMSMHQISNLHPLLVSFLDLRHAYPAENDTNDPIFGHATYKDLYMKLRQKPEFKLLFEYIFPTKRMLAIGTIYNMLIFKSIFSDPEKFEKMFQASSNTSLAIAENALNNLSGDENSALDEKY